MRGRLIVALLLLLAFLGAAPLLAQQGQIDNVVLITLDGVRTQEIFGGLDLDVLRASLDAQDVEETTAYRRFWAPTAEARREKLMPFFWGTLMTQHGSVAGNRAQGSVVEITNTRRFSYPGYAEILTGEAHDDVITSNANRRYPFPTILDFLQEALELDRTQVAAFAAWETFRWIVSRNADAFTVNAGYQESDDSDPAMQALSRQQFETPTPWNNVRHDYYTFELAMRHLAVHRPRVVYLALGETDDWAHDGRYDRAIEALARTDGYLRTLWQWLQSDDQYRDRTAIIVTTDHGRGNTTADWTDHGSETDGAQYIWIAVVSPTVPLRGEWRGHEPVYQNQIAATLARFLGLDFASLTPSAGPPIEPLFSR